MRSAAAAATSQCEANRLDASCSSAALFSLLMIATVWPGVRVCGGESASWEAPQTHIAAATAASLAAATAASPGDQSLRQRGSAKELFRGGRGLIAAAATERATLARAQAARAAVAARWQYSPLLKCQSAGRRGAQIKNATGKMLTSFQLDTRGVVAARYAAAHIPISKPNQIYISQTFRFIYVRNAKSSSTSVITALERLCCSESGEPTCSPDMLMRTSASAVSDATWRDFLVFSVVRNPIARALSAYRMFSTLTARNHGISLRQVEPDLTPGAPCGVSFDEFARDAWQLHAVCASRSCCAYVARKGRFLKQFVRGHLSLQATAVLTIDGRSAVDFIGTTEHLDEDFRDIVTLIARHSGRPLALPARVENVNGRRSRDLGRDSQQACISARDAVEARLLNETTIFDLVKQYSLDWELLEFDAGL